MEKTKITLAISGLNNNDNPGPGVPFIRGLRESRKFEVRVVGLVYEPLEPGIYLEGLCDRIFQIPDPSAGSEEFLKRIEDINSQERINVLVPKFDSELNVLIKNESRLMGLGIRTFMPRIGHLRERDKHRLPEFGKKYGIRVPRSLNLGSLGQITEMEEKFDYPVMIKGQLYDAYVATNKEQVRQAFMKISTKWGLPVIAQEFISGTEVNIVTLGDGKGNMVAAVPMQKQYITDKGKAWSGITLADEKMIQLTRSLIQQTRWRGGMELELIKTSTGEYYLIEINPRIPGWVYLAVGAGQNIPEAFIMLAMGMEPPQMNTYKIGQMFVRYSYDLIVDLEKFTAISMNKEI